MFRRKSRCRLQFDHQAIIDVQVYEILADTKPIFIIHIQRLLTHHIVTSLFKPMFKRRFIDLLKQTCTKVLMHTICYLPHLGCKRFQLFYLLYMFCMVFLSSGRMAYSHARLRKMPSATTQTAIANVGRMPAGLKYLTAIGVARKSKQ